MDAGLGAQLQRRAHLVEGRRHIVVADEILDKSKQLQLALRQHAIPPRTEHRRLNCRKCSSLVPVPVKLGSGRD